MEETQGLPCVTKTQAGGELAVLFVLIVVNFFVFTNGLQPSSSPDASLLGWGVNQTATTTSVQARGGEFLPRKSQHSSDLGIICLHRRRQHIIAKR